MSILPICITGEPVLHRAAAPIESFDSELSDLVADMIETMHAAPGVGLAAPQVGIRKQIVVIDVDDGNQYVLINPEIVETEGSQTGSEGCLSVPGKTGVVTRPEKVKVKALNEKMEEFELEGEGLLARAICHECDHLKGQLYVSLVEGKLEDVMMEEVEE